MLAGSMYDKLEKPGQFNRSLSISPTFAWNAVSKKMSPTIFRESGFRFYFFSREKPRIHVHVQGQNGEAKFWLEPK